MADRTGGARRRDRTATRAALLDAARIRFTAQGFEGTGLREIAADVGVDPALVSRYFGGKRGLFAEAMYVEIPAGVAADPLRPAASIVDALLREVVVGDRAGFAGEHPLLAMLRSAGDETIRDDLRTRLCDGYLTALSDRLPGHDAALRAELLGALLVGAGVLRSILATPHLSAADPDHLRALVARMVGALTQETGLGG